MSRAFPPARSRSAATPGAGAANSLSVRLAALGPARRAALAAALGVSATAAMPPLHLVFLLVPAFSGLLLLIDSSARRRDALAVGWWFGLGHFASGLYWIAFAFLVDAGRHAWMAPFAVAGLAGACAAFPALATLLGRVFHGLGPGRVAAFAVAWTVLEWVRSWAFTGLPWNLVGTVWTVSDSMIQATALFGVHGLGLLTVAAAAAPALLADAGATARPRRAALAIGLMAAPLALVWAGGAFRLAHAETQFVAGVRLRLVQPAIPQADKWRSNSRLGHVVEQARLSVDGVDGAAAGPPPTHVIWAETAVPFFVEDEPAIRALIAEATPAGGLTLFGAPRRTPPETVPYRVWNSLFAIDAAGRLVGTYDKHRLVPFGEYVPYRDILGLSKITSGRTDFSPGEGRRTLDLPGLPPVGPLICYEAIFPGSVVDPARRPNWLVNVTNDGWFGVSAGPYQHFAAAKLRAVEEGIPLVRVANTGISGVVDAYGRTTVSLPLGRKGVVDAALPASLEGATPYGRLGDWALLMVIAAAISSGVIVRKYNL